MAIKIDSSRGFRMGAAAFIPAKIITRQVKVKRVLELVTLLLLLFILSIKYLLQNA
jgi:hypothetical protein